MDRNAGDDGVCVDDAARCDGDGDRSGAERRCSPSSALRLAPRSPLPRIESSSRLFIFFLYIINKTIVPFVFDQLPALLAFGVALLLFRFAVVIRAFFVFTTKDN